MIDSLVYTALKIRRAQFEISGESLKKLRHLRYAGAPTKGFPDGEALPRQLSFLWSWYSDSVKKGAKPVLVLLVDDLHDVRTAHKMMLEELGHQVIEAMDGKGAIQVAAASRPDTILIDLGIADIDGLLTVAALRTISPLRSVPIVAVSDSSVHRQKAAAAGCNAYLEKPVTAERLADVLRTL